MLFITLDGERHELEYGMKIEAEINGLAVEDEHKTGVIYRFSGQKVIIATATGPYTLSTSTTRSLKILPT